MSIAICPKCKSPNDDTRYDGAWLVCAICNNRWFPSAATVDSIPTAEIPQVRKVTSKPLPTPAKPELVTRSVSGEYLPDEPDTDAQTNRALTERVDGRQSGLTPAIHPVLAAGLSQRPTLEDRSERDVGHSSPGNSSGSKGEGKIAGRASAKRPVAHDPETGPTIDSDLFDRLEEDARYKRSEMKTMPEIAYSADDPAKYRTAVPESDHSTKVNCPVCGHSYVSPGTRHVCPQCGTAYDEESNRIAAGPETKDNLIGRTLRGCLIDRKLGEGGMGAVYHAKQLSLDRSVAVKVLPVDLARNKNFIQRFEREAKSLARINHPNILQIYDFGDDPQLGLYFMIIEFVEGLDLGEVLNRRGLLDQVEVLDLLRQSVMGLEAAAEKDVIHRDIKPDNLMISGNGLVKVSDFGLAKGYVAQVGVTAAGVRVGTPAFMSPEQCDGVEVDFRSDIYNLGATVFLCLTGRLPFDGETPFAIMLKHKTEAVPSLCAIDPTISPKIDRLIGRMLAKKPADRCVSLRQLIEDIEELEIELAGTDSVLRKSRGPFKALLGGDRESSPRPRPLSPEIPLIDQVELVDLPPAPPAVASQSGGRPGMRAGAAGADSGNRRASSSGNVRRASDVPAIPAIPTTPIAGIAPLQAGSSSSDQSGRRPSRRLDVELAQARERGRRSHLDLTIANGDRLAEGGQLAEAAREWEAAAALATSDTGLQKSLRKRASGANRRVGASRLLRRSVIAAIVAVVAVAAVWAGTPPLHNWLADQWLKVRIDGLETIPQPRQKIAALNEFIANNSQPWVWYPSIFQQSYVVTAVDTARAEIKAIDNQPIATQANPGQPAGAGAEVAAVLVLAKDDTVPWEIVAQRSAELLAQARAQSRDGATFDPLRDVARQAEAELTAQRTELERITQVRAAGQAQAALDLAAAFRARHGRASATLVRLPLPGRIVVTVAGLELPADLMLTVDGARVPLTPTGASDASHGEPTAEAVICRNGDRETTFELSAEGFVAIRQTLAGSTATAERLVPVTLKPAPAWAVAFANPGATSVFVPWVQIHEMAGGLIVQHRDGILVLRPADGAVGARLERQTPTSPTFGRLWQPVNGTKLLLAQNDGSVQLIGATNLIPEQTLHRGSGEVLAWSELDLALQNGRRIHAAIERAATGTAVALVAQDATKRYWAYDKLKAASQQPQIISHDDRLYVFDDVALHLLEEDGTVVRFFKLPAVRIGMVVELPVTGTTRRELLVPILTGVLRLSLGGHQDPVRMVADPVLTQAGPAQVANLGDTVLFAGDRGSLLARCSPNPATASSLLWRNDDVRPLGTVPTLSALHVAIADDQGTVLIRTRATGAVVQRIVHGIPLAGAPIFVDLPSGPGVVLGDRAGIAAAYRLR